MDMLHKETLGKVYCKYYHQGQAKKSLIGACVSLASIAGAVALFVSGFPMALGIGIGITTLSSVSTYSCAKAWLKEKETAKYAGNTVKLVEDIKKLENAMWKARSTKKVLVKKHDRLVGIQRSLELVDNQPELLMMQKQIDELTQQNAELQQRLEKHEPSPSVHHDLEQYKQIGKQSLSPKTPLNLGTIKTNSANLSQKQ